MEHFVCSKGSKRYLIRLGQAINMTYLQPMNIHTRFLAGNCTTEGFSMEPNWFASWAAGMHTY